MPRRKIAISLIGNRRARAATYAKRKDGLMKKARELATLCDIPVAVVCAGPDGGAPEAWLSEDGVFDRYRALVAEKKAGHTHQAYLWEQLGKEKARLAKLQQDGPNELAPPDAALNGMTLDELNRLLESIEMKLRATARRRNALVLLADDDGTDGGRWPDAAVSLGHHGVPCTAVGLHRYQQQVHAPGNGAAQLVQFTWNSYHPYNAGVPQPGYNVHSMDGHGVDMNGYQLQMPCHGNNNYGQFAREAFLPHNAVVQPSYGDHLQYPDSNGICGYQTQAPANSGWHNPVTFGHGDPCNAIVSAGHNPVTFGHGEPCNAIVSAGHNPVTFGHGEPCNAIVPAGHNPVTFGHGEPCNAIVSAGHNPVTFGHGEPCNATVPAGHNPPCNAIVSAGHNPGTFGHSEHSNANVPAEYPYMDTNGNNFMDTTSQFLAMSRDESFVNVGGGYGYGTQSSDASQNPCSLEPLHYLSDLADCFDGHGTKSSDASQNSCNREQLHLSDLADCLDFESEYGPLDLDLWVN
ncbi:hypothetical protein GUJ93_ZPchr0001g29792 [Zizania palustris]|uniref:MADS-box domain-containing protein n=1 Tax=Zizania palustris TaxID=103762 RepID=A0A8J5V8G9_ZIZPA|nr:hypothetical protein GUJ93_ZPchr0001g29792 [Zizania palustris]